MALSSVPPRINLLSDSFLGCETRSWLDEITLDKTAEWPQHPIAENLQMSEEWKLRFDAFIERDDSTGWEAIFMGTNENWFTLRRCGGRLGAVWINSDQQRIDENIDVQEGQFRKAQQIKVSLR